MIYQKLQAYLPRRLPINKHSALFHKCYTHKPRRVLVIRLVINCNLLLSLPNPGNVVKGLLERLVRKRSGVRAAHGSTLTVVW